jgi:hypothetical protein
MPAIQHTHLHFDYCTAGLKPRTNPKSTHSACTSMHISILIIAPFHAKATTATASIALPTPPDRSADARSPQKPSQQFPSHRRRSGPLISQPFSFTRTIATIPIAPSAPSKPTASSNQERRASARRGNETRLQWREFFPERVRSRTTGGLRPPLLAVLRCEHLPTKLRLVRYTNARFRRAAGVSPPWCNVPTMCRENRRLSGDWRSEQQERRVSARRGNETHLQWREFFPERVRSRTTGGLRPRSWLHVRMSLQIRASHQRVRCSSHGGLTPPRSWLHLRLLLQICVSHRRACQCFPRLAYVSRSWWMAMR